MKVTVADLKDQICMNGPRPFLYCSKCGAEYSANAADYWNVPKDHVFKCCKRNMSLVVKRVHLAKACRPDPCIHESELTADGNGAFCKHCGKTLC